jgi:parallel beta-helix repeat protein
MTKRTRVAAELVSLLALILFIQGQVLAQAVKSQQHSQKFPSRTDIRNSSAPINLFGSFAPRVLSYSAEVPLLQDGSAVHPITKATTITESGSYVLLQDIALHEPGTAIVIAADNVSLNLNGHALVGPGNKQGVGIAIDGFNGIRVHNGTIASFGTGLRIANARDVRVESLQIRGEDGGGPGPGEVGVLLLNSRAVVLKDNTISQTFLGIFVRGGGSSGNRIASNTVTGGQTGQLGICYNPDGSGNLAGPTGDLVYNNLISRFKIGIQTSVQTAGNIFRENDIAFVQLAIQENTPGSNVFVDNTSIAIGL